MWVHANVLTAPLMRELFRHQGPYLLNLVLWRFPRMFSGFALFVLHCQAVHCYLWYHRRIIAFHWWMWKQWLLKSFLWIYSCSLSLYLNWHVSSAWRYRIVFHKFFIFATSLRGVCIRDAKFAPCVDLRITSSVPHFTTSGFLLSSSLAAVNMTRFLLR